MSDLVESRDDTIWHGDGREKALQTYLRNHPNLEALRNNPSEILSTIDSWAVENNHTMMTIGPDRSERIVDEICSTRPKVMAELGGYIGYSAILFANEVRNSGGKKYISFEFNSEYARIAEWIVGLAGLSDFVQIIVGKSADGLVQLAINDERKVVFDILFIDHWEEVYLSDLRICEDYGLVKKGSVVVADNAGNGEADEYVRWVEEGEKYMSTRVPCVLPNGRDDVVLISRMV